MREILPAEEWRISPDRRHALNLVIGIFVFVFGLSQADVRAAAVDGVLRVHLRLTLR